MPLDCPLHLSSTLADPTHYQPRTPTHNARGPPVRLSTSPRFDLFGNFHFPHFISLLDAV
ncbi:hypothetical protein C8R44DRAFT_762546 [Mycena epipterygia]|nr:hypothetical protein C8R44DRAFT_762546 [Mycena epipterygia]